MEQREVCGVSGVLSQDTPTKTVQHYGKGHRDDGKRRLWIDPRNEASHRIARKIVESGILDETIPII
jgi:hypothetical protein